MPVPNNPIGEIAEGRLAESSRVRRSRCSRSYKQLHAGSARASPP